MLRSLRRIDEKRSVQQANAFVILKIEEKTAKKLLGYLWIRIICYLINSCSRIYLLVWSHFQHLKSTIFKL
jgi:hypothetical protein